MQEPTPSPKRRELARCIWSLLPQVRDAELHRLLWRLVFVIQDLDCPETSVAECRSLFDSSRRDLAEKLVVALPRFEQEREDVRKKRDRINASRVTESQLEQERLYQFYSAMSVDELSAVWSNKKDDLPAQERDVVRAVMRNRTGIGQSSERPRELCGHCFLAKANCVCERGWW